jgi:hypothetical protein
MVLQRNQHVHMQPFSMWLARCADSSTSIAYHWTIPMPTRWQTTSCNHSLHPACGCLARQDSERRCTGDMELSQCHQRVQQEVFQGYSVLELCIELVSCSRAQIQSKSQLMPTILYHANNANNSDNSDNIWWLLTQKREQWTLVSVNHGNVLNAKITILVMEYLFTKFLF